MSKLTTFVIILLCLTGAYPVESLLSRWFSATYTDLQATIKRYGHCVSSLGPKRDANGLNETDYLINKMRVFLDEANLENEQLSNLTILMDNICRPEPNPDYPISVYVDINLFNGTAGKKFRCKAIDTVMDSMYEVFKRASLNGSDPLDFSTIQYYPNATNNEASYNLTDLINTSWIKSDMQVEHICKITSAVKEYIRERVRTSKPQSRDTTVGPFGSVLDFIDRYILGPIFGLQRRIYWDSSNSYEIVYSSVSNQFGNLGRGFGSRLKTTRDRLSSMFPTSSRSANSSIAVKDERKLNSTMLNVTQAVTPTTTPIVFSSSSSSSSSSSPTTVAPEMSPTTIMSPAPIMQSSVLMNVTTTTLAPSAKLNVGSTPASG